MTAGGRPSNAILNMIFVAATALFVVTMLVEQWTGRKAAAGVTQVMLAIVSSLFGERVYSLWQERGPKS